MSTIRCNPPQLDFDTRFNELESCWSAYDAYLEDPQGSEEPVIDAVVCCQLASSLLQECPDLRVAILKLRAELRKEGLISLADSIKGIDQILMEYGEQAHPASDDETPGSGHALALAWLASSHCARELLATPMHQATSACLAEAEKCGLRLDPRATYSSWEDVEHAIDRIDENVNARATDFTWHPDALREVARKARRLFVVERRPNCEAGAVAPTNCAEAPPAPPNLPTFNTQRRAALANIEAAIVYFAEHEPGHPAPILLRRVLRMVDMDFHALVAELMPEATDSLARISGAYHHDAT